jgi:MoxR-like ATPase
MKEITARIEKLLQALNQDMYEKEKAVRLALLSALAGESIFLLGPPGVAKSLIARRLKFAFREARSFEYLMGKFSTPDEVFGPVSINKLKNEDKYERLTDKYLPGANIVFLDEIWKSSPPIQNSLLTVLNEKIYRNGEQEFKVDIRGLISASNELPLEGEGLEALWDRFLIRLVVKSIEDETLFNQMINLPARGTYHDPVPEELKISDTEYQTWGEAIDQIRVPAHIFGLINRLRWTIRDRNLTAEPGDKMYVSDRRWRKITLLLKTSAFLNGREEIDLMDCFLIADCIWDKHKQVEEAAAIVMGAIANHGYRRLIKTQPIRDELETLRKEIKEETQIVSLEDQEVLKLKKDDAKNDFAQINDFFGRGSAAFIRLTDWEKIKEDRKSYIPVFEQAGNSFHPFQTYQIKRLDDFTGIEKGRELKLETEMVQREVVNARKPRAGTVKIWNSQVGMMLDMLDQNLKKIEQRRAADVPYLENNLFVSQEFAAHVMDSLESCTHELLNLKLEIQKTQHLYESIEKSG